MRQSESVYRELKCRLGRLASGFVTGAGRHGCNSPAEHAYAVDTLDMVIVAMMTIATVMAIMANSAEWLTRMQI